MPDPSTSPAPTLLGSVPRTDVDALLDRYEVVLIDAFGVLVNNVEALPGAVELVERLEREGRPWAVVTNDASKHATTSAARYRDRGLPIQASRVVTSGSLLPGWFASEGLDRSDVRCVVLGPPDSQAYVLEAGVDIVEPDEHGVLDVLVVADDAGYPMLETFDAVISQVFNTIEAGRRPHLVLPNPDLIYPKGGGRFGITAGSVALVIAAAIELRYPRLGVEFVKLGKPFPPIYEAALAHLDAGRNAVLLGDQLRTDVLGANRVGIDSCLVGTGVTPVSDEMVLHDPEAIPTWWMQALSGRP